MSKIQDARSQDVGESFQLESSKPAPFTTLHLESIHGYNDLKSDNVLLSTVHYIKKYYKPSRSCCMTIINKRLPCFSWIRTYDLKEYLLKDLIGGLTV